MNAETQKQIELATEEINKAIEVVEELSMKYYNIAAICNLEKIETVFHKLALIEESYVNELNNLLNAVIEENKS